ncbi:hypothetical protein GCM10007147_09610 [Nocardiopsis kunsanensis]|uniref:Protein kinase domain-containing protein n=2 Tax=Nocardiopsis kunsanensis TaxID=141693 RepID=A0A918XA88_9ACTN|nr:hypothetical protein GCM10007147_09610 [Nocardiopsis kunsanensis]
MFSPPPSPEGAGPMPSLPPGVQPLDGRDPRRVGPFRLVGRLGSGGMGVVYAALDDEDRRVAVKTVHRVFASDAEFRTRFAREVALVRRVRAACVPRFLESDTRAEVPWLATEYVAGPTLAEHLRDHGPLRETGLVLFALGTAEALTAIHAAGVVHRDLKPGNVILAPDGPKVLDFGIARAVEETALTRTGGVVGTPGWIAPEQYRGEDATGYSDVFAWACLLAHAATGREPFGSGSTGAVVTRVLGGAPDLDGVPGALALSLEQALAKDPDRRPRADALMRELAVLVPEEAAPGGGVDVTFAMGQAWQGSPVRSGAGPGAGPERSGSAVGAEIDRWIAHAPPKEPWVRRHRRGLALGAGALALALLAAVGLGMWAGRADGGSAVPQTPPDGRNSQGTGDQDRERATEIPEDVPDQYRGLYESGTVVVEPVPGDGTTLVRSLVSEDGGEQLDQLRIDVYGGDSWESRQSVKVELEYLLDFGSVHVRPSDFGWAERIAPGQDHIELLRWEEPVQSNLAMSPDSGTRRYSMSFSTTGDGVVYYAPEEVREDGQVRDLDYPGGVCHLGEVSGPDTVLFPHDTTSSDGVPRNSCIFDGT